MGKDRKDTGRRCRLDKLGLVLGLELGTLQSHWSQQDCLSKKKSWSLDM